ncbi:SEC-C domain-containing protein [Bacillus sp. 31A1R]|uniref:SEC-C domain-containing protein n=1 Tax=Robertmurraya mangrovi TaxID=3098077 RepID=A0ABU5IXV1_9BACI|nr:SEC-C domain-containing protein [Bacillus sp. 31A1R]MDZ5471983.1 SEC-C domain-containing protein [Bacillus sp. 31A1R]
MAIKQKRNEPCLCGSGKKYKKCCGANESVSITSILENEIMDLQGDIIRYGLDEYDFEIDADFDYVFGDPENIEEPLMEFLVLTHTIWFSIFKPLNDGETILQKYIKQRGKMIQRPMLREILNSWTEAKPIVGKIISYSAQEMVVQDSLTGDTEIVKVLDNSEEPISNFLFGILVPFNDEQVFFPDFFDFDLSANSDNIEMYFKQTFDESPYEDPKEFLKEQLLLSIFNLQYEALEVSANDLDWENPMHSKVALKFEEVMNELNAPEEFISAGIILWHQFCVRKPKRIVKADLYVAATEYVVMSINPFIEITMKEIATRYEISESSLKKIVSEMKDELAEPLRDLEYAMVKEYAETSGIL